jgi:SAM-dependent methyltransferase
LYLARLTGCQVTGVELYEEAVTTANRMAAEAQLEAKARFVKADASQPLPFEDAAFDAILCVDAINHLPAREAVLTNWGRLLRADGRLLFTDPVTVTGPLAAMTCRSERRSAMACSCPSVRTNGCWRRWA